MKVVTIGGSGFVGTRLLGLLTEAAREKGESWEVKNVDLQPSHFFPDVTVIGDARVREDMERELKGADVVVLLAAQHRDDVWPVDLYCDTNVGGMKTVLAAMESCGVKRILFFSSVAVYGINKKCPDENHAKDPFNHYGKSKWEAEQVLRSWWEEGHRDWNVTVVRPTVIFGERNRGNVYNLLRQISGGRFLMVGKGENRKSMAYVGNVVTFVKYALEHLKEGYNVFNYVDKPDLTMNELVSHVSKVLHKHIPMTHFPYWMGMAGGYCFDLLAKMTGKKLAVSSVRVKKFCATTEFDATKAHTCGFKAPYTLAEGMARTLEFEFVHPQPADGITFKSE